MIYLLDTNMISLLMKSNQVVWQKLNQVEPNQVCTSSVNYAEILYGLKKNPQATKQLAAFHIIMDFVQVFDFDIEVAKTYGQFRAQAEQSGKNLAPLDMIIAAHAYHFI